MDNSGVTSHRPVLADGPIYLDAIMAANNGTGVLQPITDWRPSPIRPQECRNNT
jgi:hypothetical protein